MNLALKKWLQVSLFNLLLVATVGVVLRYKIAFSLPFVDQKNLLHGHSHFAFAGWITQALMALLVNHLYERGQINAFNKYRWLLYANLITAYGMLFCFPVQGYAFLSILFSTLSIIVSYVFAVMYWRNLNKMPYTISHVWFKASLFFNAISSFGAFSLAYMLATKHFDEKFYLASIYFFLHFQYNGWFYFACMGLLSYRLLRMGASELKLKQVCYLFLFACVPAYFLSALWLHISNWVYWLVVLAALLQVVGWIQFIGILNKMKDVLKIRLSVFSRRVLLLSALALTIKLMLQALSVIPSLSQLAFGFRPIVIGYLHLVLLAVISLFILGYMMSFVLSTNKLILTGFTVFIAGIILNETLLMIQGFGDLYYVSVPYINILLFIVSLLLFGGMFILNYGSFFSNYAPAHKS
jgi:hypothetical protein